MPSNARIPLMSTTTPFASSLNSPADSSQDDPYLPLARLAQYAGVSERQLRRFMADRVHPLPSFHLGRLVRVRKSDYDRWLAERQHPETTTPIAEDWTDDDRRMALALSGH